MKTHFKKLKNPTYLGSWDLADENGKFIDKIVTLVDVKKEMVHDGNGGKEECVTATIKEGKSLILNATNLKTIAKVFDSNFIEDWAGKKIVLTVKKIKAFGEFHDALRVLPQAPKKEELNPTHPSWGAAKEAIKNGKTTIEQIKTKYTISDENTKAIQN